MRTPINFVFVYAAVNVIDAGIAARLGYEVVGEREIGAPGGPQISMITWAPWAR